MSSSSAASFEDRRQSGLCLRESTLFPRASWTRDAPAAMLDGSNPRIKLRRQSGHGGMLSNDGHHRQVLGRLRRLARERNVFALLQLSQKAIPRWLLFFDRVVITRSELVPEISMPRDVIFRRVEATPPLEAFERLAEPGADASWLQRRFHDDLASGREGFAGWQGDAIVAYAWAARGHQSMTEVKCDLLLQPDEACTYRSYVIPALRLSRVYGGMARFTLQELRARGIRWFIGYGQYANRHSIRTHQRMGYEIVGWVLMVEFLAWALHVRNLACEGNRRRWELSRRKRGAACYTTVGATLPVTTPLPQVPVVATPAA